MRELNAMELCSVQGGLDGIEPPLQWQGISQAEWDQFIEFLEDQQRRNGSHQGR